MTDADRDTIEAMKRYGGAFVCRLGLAAERADDDNLRRIRDAFPEYWNRYSRIARDRRAEAAR